MDSVTQKHGRIKNLTCSCCGASTRGRQWHNRDTGFGLCPECAEWIVNRKPFGRPSEYADPEVMTRCYGIKGIHYDIKEKTA